MKRHLTLLLGLLSLLFLAGCMDMPGSWQYDYGRENSAIIDDAQPEALLIDTAPLRQTNASVILKNNGDPNCRPIVRLKVRDDKGTETPVGDYSPEPTPGRLLFRNIPMEGGKHYLLYAARTSEAACSITSRKYLNSDLELEDTEDTQAKAQDISASFLPLQEGAWRGFVAGRFFSAADVDFYTFPLEQGERINIVLESPQQGTVVPPFSAPRDVLEDLPNDQLAAIEAMIQDSSSKAAFASADDVQIVLQSSKGSVVTGKRLPGLNVDTAYAYTAPASGTYSLKVQGGANLVYPYEYRVLILRNAQLEQERNDSILSAQPVPMDQPVLGFLGEASNGTQGDGALPKSITGGKIRLSINDGGGFGILNQNAIEVDGLEYLSIFWPHQPVLTAPISGDLRPLNLSSAAVYSSYTGNRQDVRITGEFLFGGLDIASQRIQFQREVTWYNDDKVILVRTILTNPGDTGAENLTLNDDFFPASPGSPDPAVLSMLANGRLAAATGNGHTFGIGSPDTNLTLKIVPRTPEQTDSRPGMISAALPVSALPAKSSVVTEFFMVFGDTPSNTAALYESTVRTGFNASDFYRVTLQKGRPYRFQALLATNYMGPLQGIGIEILDEQGKRLADAPAVPESASCVVAFRAPETKNYYVRVYNEIQSQLTGNDYVFTVEDLTTIIHLPLVNRP